MWRRHKSTGFLQCQYDVFLTVLRTALSLSFKGRQREPSISKRSHLTNHHPGIITRRPTTAEHDSPLEVPKRGGPGFCYPAEVEEGITIAPTRARLDASGGWFASNDEDTITSTGYLLAYRLCYCQCNDVYSAGFSKGRFLFSTSVSKTHSGVDEYLFGSLRSSQTQGCVRERRQVQLSFFFVIQHNSYPAHVSASTE